MTIDIPQFKKFASELKKQAWEMPHYGIPELPDFTAGVIVLASSVLELTTSVDRLTAENAELREAVKGLLVHKVYWGCPWCLSYVDESNKIIHADNCPRQRAAALVGEPDNQT